MLFDQNHNTGKQNKPIKASDMLFITSGNTTKLFALLQEVLHKQGALCNDGNHIPMALNRIGLWWYCVGSSIFCEIGSDFHNTIGFIYEGGKSQSYLSKEYVISMTAFSK